MKKQEPNEFDRNSDTILSRDVTRINKCIHEQKKNYNETLKRPWKKRSPTHYRKPTKHKIDTKNII